jgi:hypothetical protein
MSDEQIREAYLFYEELHNNPNIQFQLYTECSSTYGKDRDADSDQKNMW